jgi:hypothetical protein
MKNLPAKYREHGQVRYNVVKVMKHGYIIFFRTHSSWREQKKLEGEKWLFHRKLLIF